MMTEKGTVKTVTYYDKKFFNKVQKSAYISCSLGLIVAAVLIVVSALFYTSENSGNLDDIMMMVWASILFVAVTILLIFLRFKTNKALKLEKSLEFEIYSDCLLITEYEKGQKSGAVRTFYSDYVKKREVKYYFQIFRTQSVAYYISKEGMTAAELNAVRRVLGLKYKGVSGEETVQLPAFGCGNFEFAVPADDIFGDLDGDAKTE